MLLAASEIASNALRHGRGIEDIRVGHVQGRFVCEIIDRGPGFDDPAAGYLAPRAGAGRGLWVARQLTWRLELFGSPRGFTARGSGFRRGSRRMLRGQAGAAGRDSVTSRSVGCQFVGQRQLAIGDRELTVYDEGDPGGPVILVHHGTPAAGPPLSGWVQDAAARGARLLAYDRPGYGASTSSGGRAVGDAAADAASIMDALDVERFVSWGVSGGGPHALACAALLPDRVAAACSIGGVAPFDAPGLNYFRGMGEDNIVELGLAMAGREHLVPFAATTAGEMLAHLDDLAASIQTLVAEPDRVALAGPIGEWWAAGIRVSFSSGADGWVDDDLAFCRPFGFELDAITTPLLVVHGRLDQFVPISHGQWLSRAIPGAESWMLDDEAHLSLLANQVSDVHGWLLGHLET